LPCLSLMKQQASLIKGKRRSASTLSCHPPVSGVGRAQVDASCLHPTTRSHRVQDNTFPCSFQVHILIVQATQPQVAPEATKQTLKRAPSAPTEPRLISSRAGPPAMSRLGPPRSIRDAQMALQTMACSA